MLFEWAAKLDTAEKILEWLFYIQRLPLFTESRMPEQSDILPMFIPKGYWDIPKRMEFAKKKMCHVVLTVSLMDWINS